MLRQCPVADEVTQNDKFKKDINCFYKYMAGTNIIFMIDQDARQPVQIYIDDCTAGCVRCARVKPNTLSSHQPSSGRTIPFVSWNLSM